MVVRPGDREPARLSGDTTVLDSGPQAGSAGTSGAGGSGAGHASYRDDSLYLLVGHGDGTFGPPVAIPVAGTPGNMRAADINGDGLWCSSGPSRTPPRP